MKIIVSSDLLRNKIKEAFDVDAHCIKSYINLSGGGTLTFGTKKYQSDIELSCQFRDKDSTVVNFNNFAMAKLYDFLRLLKNQPIVVELDNDAVRVEQFVIDFV